MIWQNQAVFPLIIVSASGGFTGLFVYSPSPGAGKLIVSIAGVSGTDAYGNAYLGVAGGGYVAYGLVGGVQSAAAYSATGVGFFTAPSEAGPYTQVGTGAVISWDVTGSVAFLNLPVLVQQGGGAIFRVQEITGAPASPPTQLLAQTAGDRALGIEVTGDANFRFRVDSNGRMDWGTGAAVTDTDLFRTTVLGTPVLKTDNGVVIGNGVTVSAGGLTVTAGGLVVTAGGATITAGGLTVSGGLSALNGSATVVGAGAITTVADLEVHSLVALASRAAPATPPAGFGFLYVSSVDGSLHYKGHSGTDTQVAPG